jgi:ABC-type bacteriocin/lantibiotic exporter with double-glycine peptidase domain
MRKIKEYLSFFLSYSRAHKQQKAEIDFHARDPAFLVPHAKINFPRYIGLFFLLLLSSGLSLPGPAITGYIVDKVFVRKDASKLDLLAGFLLAILILSELVRIVQEYAMLRTSQEFTYSIHVHLIGRMLQYPLSFFKDFQTGYLVSQFSFNHVLSSRTDCREEAYLVLRHSFYPFQLFSIPGG